MAKKVILSDSKNKTYEYDLSKLEDLADLVSKSERTTYSSVTYAEATEPRLHEHKIQKHYFDPDEPDELEDISYETFSTRLKNIYNSYLESHDRLCLFKLLLFGFNNGIHDASAFDPKRPGGINIDRRVNESILVLAENLHSGSLKMEISPEEQNIVADFLIKLYNSPIDEKLFYMSISYRKVCDILLAKAIRKGVIIDKEVFEKLKKSKLDGTLIDSEKATLELVYVPSQNFLLYIGYNENKSSYPSPLGLCHRVLDKLPDVLNDPLPEDDMIEIDGKKYVRRIFESIVESSYDNFISNLEIETLINNKEIAEDSVVDEKIKLL